METRCENCRWWRVGEDSFQKKEHEKKGVGRCGNPALLDMDENDNIPPDGFGLNYPVCDLVTGPNFSCSHFTPTAKADSYWIADREITLQVRRPAHLGVDWGTKIVAKAGESMGEVLEDIGQALALFVNKNQGNSQHD